MNLTISNTLIAACIAILSITKITYSASTLTFDIISTLNYIQVLLMHIGPLLSAVLFVIAGIFYAIGQFFPSYQRAAFHTTAGDMVIGAIIVAVLSVASTSLALASAHLLANTTISNIT